jgi:hypothetical protein
MNDLSEYYDQYLWDFEVFATNLQSAVTRRNPWFSAVARMGLWQACGKSAVGFTCRAAVEIANSGTDLH